MVLVLRKCLTYYKIKHIIAPNSVDDRKEKNVKYSNLYFKILKLMRMENLVIQNCV